jgi:hypothetical protein
MNDEHLLTVLAALPLVVHGDRARRVEGTDRPDASGRLRRSAAE